MSALCIMPAVALFAGRGLAAFGDLIGLTVETTDGYEYHSNSLCKRGRAWHTKRRKSTSTTRPNIPYWGICKKPHNVVEQDHRGVKRITRPMLGFKTFDAAQSTMIYIELIHMLYKGQLAGGVEQGLTMVEQFYALAA